MKPSQRINRTYELKNTAVIIPLDSRSIEVPVTLNLELSPIPRFSLNFEFENSDAAAMNELNRKREVRVYLDNGHSIDTIVGDRLFLGGGKISNVLIPKSEPITVRDDRVSLARCKFVLLNFPSMWGNKDIRRYPDPSNTAFWLSYERIQLEANPWLIDIFAVDSLMSVHHGLVRRGGSAITHTGTITRIDKHEFGQDDLGELLKALHLFLSFARGSYCGLTLISGHNSNRKRVWEQWGTFKVEPWRRTLSTWVDIGSSHMLSPVFAGLWKLLNHREHGGTITQVINWYLRSNESSEPEVSIVLTQAALERLAAYTVGPKPQDTKEGDWIAQSLKGMGIDANLPPSCPNIQRLQNSFKWSHGPHALVAIRNDLVHPRNKVGSIKGNALLEAQALGLHYVELMLLCLSNYTGKYVNRLKTREPYPSMVEVVPVTPS